MRGDSSSWAVDIMMRQDENTISTSMQLFHVKSISYIWLLAERQKINVYIVKFEPMRWLKEFNK